MARTQHAISSAPVMRFLFSDTRSAFGWLVIRIYVGWSWLHAGWGKIQSELWVGDRAGTALHGFVQRALEKTSGPHPDVPSWYAWFLSHIVLPYTDVWGHVIAWGECAVGVGLLLGILTGVAAFFGSFMNLNFLLAGTISINPVLGVLGFFLVLAWRVAGYYGVDRVLLPMLGTPWQPGRMFHR